MLIHIGHSIHDCDSCIWLSLEDGYIRDAGHIHAELLARSKERCQQSIVVIEVHTEVVLDFVQCYQHSDTSIKEDDPASHESIHISAHLFGSRSSRLDLQNLDCFRQDELAIDALLGNEANHAVTGKKLVELLEGTSTTVTDVVVAVITEGDSIHRSKRRSMDFIAEQTVRLTMSESRLPHIGTVVVLEGTDSCDGLVVQDELGVLAVRALQCIDQLHDVVGSQSSDSGCDSPATSFSEEPQRLADTGTVEEGILLSIGECLTELSDDVVLQTESVVVEQLLSNLDSDMELVGIEQNLGEGRIRELESAAFLNPCCSRLSGCDVDFVLAGSGNLVGQLTHDVLLVEDIDEAVVILFRNEVTAVCIYALLKDIADLTEVGAHSSEHSFLIGIGSATGLFLLLIASGRLGGERSVHRLGKLSLHCLLTLQTRDFLAEVSDVLLHLGVSGVVLSSQSTVFGTMGIEKCLSGIPCSVTLFAQFKNSHNEIPPLNVISDKVQSLHQSVDGAFVCSGFLLDAAFCSQLVHEGVGDSSAGKEHRAIGLVLHRCLARTHQDFIGKA
nr:MAG TPA: hypothetical protein [Caudoviricetes sp.]